MILAAAGHQAAVDMAGIDLFEASAVTSRPAIFGDMYSHEAEDPVASLQYRCCIEDRWKLILPHADGDAARLYDVVADPHEEHSLVLDFPLRVSTLACRIDLWWSASPHE